MASTCVFNEDNGAAVGSPPKGTTRTNPITQANWKNTDDNATTPEASVVLAGNNSYTKYTFARITGTFTSIGNGLWAHTAGALGTGLTLKGVVTSTYATPSTAANAALTTNMTAVIAIASGAAVLFSTVGPEAAGAGATLAAAGYSQYLAFQMQTTVAAASGASAIATFTLQYDET